MAGGILGLQHSRFALFQDSVFPLSGRSLVRWSTCKSKPISGPAQWAGRHLNVA
jgi:hypothetical protein